MADLCGVSGSRRRARRPRVQPVQSRRVQPGRPDAGLRAVHGRQPGYKTEYDNFAPNVGVAWQPNVQSGWLRTILGDPAQATIRASYGVSYNSDGLGVLPGRLRQQSRQPDHDEPHDDERAVPAGARRRVVAGAAATAGAAWAVAGDSGRRPVYPMAIDFNSGVNLFHPNFKTPFARSYSVGLQRTISRQMAVEVRYVGTRLVDGTATENWNEVNWTTNGFLDEFKLAQANLQANIASGVAARANSFAYFGPGTGHVAAADLPRELQRPAAEPVPAIAALYTGTNWTNTARLAELARAQSQPGRRARTRCSTTRRSARTWSRPAIRATSSSSIRTSATRRSDQRQYHEVRLAADQPASRAVGRAGGRRQLHVRQALRVHARHAAARRGARAVDRTACRTRSRRR